LLVCYAAAAGGARLVDRQLLSIDQWLGYDWEGYARYCSARPWLLQTYRYAYNSNLTQPALIGALLHLTRQEVRFEKFVLANVVAVLITALIFLFLPATTAWTVQGQEAYASHLLPDLPITTNSWLGDLLQIRNGNGRYIFRLAGIVAFPSFHCVSAILNLWAIWRLRWLRVPFGLLNAVMLAATPIIGGHYLCDVLGGFAVAVATIAAVGPLHRYLRDLKLWELMGARIPRFSGLAG
jgi:membrane-associated phospholipid phosphatase